MLASFTALVLLAVDPQQRNAPPTAEELAAITARGRSLAGYDQAAWHASDALQAKFRQPEGVRGYVARKTEKGWAVAFGRLDDQRAKYLIAFEATQGKDANQFVVKKIDPPREETGFFRSAARAIETAQKDFTAHFQGEPRPYNVAVLPAEKGQFWVYFVPAATKPGVWPLGGDVRYLVSEAGTRIQSKRQLHKSIIENEPPKDPDNRQVAGIHTHVLDDVPEDTDVFHVQARKPSVPEMIVTKQFVFQVDPDGAIKYVGKSEDVLKNN
jgi:hypothetical protein